MNKSLKLFSICATVIFLFTILFSCSKDKSDGNVPDPKKDKWVTDIKKDSLGNQYYVANTYDSKLEIRVKNAAGKIIFSEICPTIDSAEIPVSVSTVITSLVSPSRFISIHDATLSIMLVNDSMDEMKNYVQLLANLNIENKKFYTKKYKVQKPQDWTYKFVYNALAQWNQNTLLVCEGTDHDLNKGGGFMGLGQRGTQLVCYDRDFSVRFTKDIDATEAYIPTTGGDYIPLNDYECIAFRTDGLITRLQIVTSAEDQWAGKKYIVWQVDLKKRNELPADYSVKLKDYNIQDTRVITTYDIYDEAGKFKESRKSEWDLSTGFPRTKL